MVSSRKEKDDMIQPGSLSLFIHLLINTYHNVIKKYPIRAFSCMVVLVVASIIIINGRAAVTNSLKDNNGKILGEMTYKCKPVKEAYSDKKIILRLDDIQAFAYSEISQMMIEDSISRKMKLVLGVIPYNLTQDAFITNVLKKNNCNLELALHGWDHSISPETGVYEFEDMDEAEAASKIKEGKSILEQIGGQPVVTFIPPGNLISSSTKKVLKQEGIKYLSGDTESSIYGIDATTYDFQSKKLNDNSDILNKCDERFSKNKFCVIVIHPQDYLTDDKIDEDKYSQFINLLDEFRNEQVLSITFNSL
jgi:hypothetical protein